MTLGDQPPPFAKYNADGTGRDTYIRRDPVECFGKMQYKPEERLVTRFGAAGSAVPRQPGPKPAAFDPVGGPKESGFDFSRPARFIRPPAESYPVSVGHYSTMKDIVQDGYVSLGQAPGTRDSVSGYTGFKPRCPAALFGSSSWTDIPHAK